MIHLKTYLISLMLLCLSNNSFSQGINFIYDLEAASQLAKKENKLIFIDFYTSWCGPCKMMSAEVFPQKEVGDYFNQNFINLKVQCDDKGTGEVLGKKFKIAAYPTLMFIDSETNVVHATAGGLSPQGLIDLAKIASDPNSNQLKLVKEWESGNRNHDFTTKYFQTLIQSYRGEKAITDFEKYFDGLPANDKASQNTFELMQILKVTPFSTAFDYMEQHKKDYYKSIGKSKIDSTISNGYLWYFKRLQSVGLTNNDLREFDEKMKLFKDKKYPFYKEYAQFYEVFNAKNSEGKADVDLYMQRGTAFLNKYGTNNNEYTIALAHLLGNYTSRKDQSQVGIQWMEELIARDNNPNYLTTYFYITWRNFQWDKASEIAQRMKADAVANNKSTALADKNIQLIQDLKIKYPN